MIEVIEQYMTVNLRSLAVETLAHDKNTFQISAGNIREWYERFGPKMDYDKVYTIFINDPFLKKHLYEIAQKIYDNIPCKIRGNDYDIAMLGVLYTIQLYTSSTPPECRIRPTMSDMDYEYEWNDKQKWPTTPMMGAGQISCCILL